MSAADDLIMHKDEQCDYPDAQQNCIAANDKSIANVGNLGNPYELLWAACLHALSTGCDTMADLELESSTLSPAPPPPPCPIKPLPPVLRDPPACMAKGGSLSQFRRMLMRGAND
jgi:hypothetical protein